MTLFKEAFLGELRTARETKNVRRILRPQAAIATINIKYKLAPSQINLKPLAIRLLP